jgi:chromosomal replication initiation ATPase DnaA
VSNQSLPVISKPMIERIIRAACAYFDITEDELKQKSQCDDVVYRRKLCYYLIRQEVIISNARIAQRFGYKDADWVSKSIEEIEARKGIFPQISRDLTAILQIANNLADSNNHFQNGMDRG